jgi:hypothetical protein
MKWGLIAATLAAAFLIGPAQAQEDPLSGNYPAVNSQASPCPSPSSIAGGYPEF